MISQSKWKWFGNAGHFICARWCRFHLCTHVGKYLISTVGEYWPERSSREIHAKVYDPTWFVTNCHLKDDTFDAAYMDKFGFEEISYGRKYETSVFLAGKPCGCGCGLPELLDASELDALRANDAKTATGNHMKLCLKYARKSL